MRHGNRLKKLGRTSAHRKATLAALSTSLIEHKRITTTLPKAKALRSFVEPIINRAKEDTTHNRRQVFRRLQSKEAVKSLFGEVAEVLGDRPGGYTRVVKLGQRAGDSAEMAIIELVDFNDMKPLGADSGKKKTRRSRAKSTGATASAATVAEETVGEAEDVVEGVEEEVVEAVADVSDGVEVAEEEVSEAEVNEVAGVVENVVVDDAVEVSTEVEAATVEEVEAAAEVVEEAEAIAEEEVAPEAEAGDEPSDEADATDESEEEKAE